MIAPFALAITRDERRVVKLGHPDGAFLLAPQGAEIKERFVPLVLAYLESIKPKQESSPSMATETEAISSPTSDVADPILNLRKRRGRGRPRRSEEFGGE